MGPINSMRAILVAAAAGAAAVAAVLGMWLTVAILVLGMAFHGGLWVVQHRAAAPPPADLPQ